MFNQNNLKRPAASFAAVIGLSLLLSACGGELTPEPGKPDPKPPTEQVGLIKGQITPFKAGDASSVSAGVEAEGDTPLASASVNSAGKFDLALPDSAKIKGDVLKDKLVKASDLFGACSDVETNAPADLRVVPINLLLTDKDVQIIAPVNSDPKVYSYKSWVFSDVEASFNFKGNCFGLDDVTATVALKRGWNVFDTQYNVESKKTTYTAASQPKPKAEEYSTWVKAGQSISSQALSANILQPWKNLPEYQNR